jgi:hypothetical protein
MKRYILSCAVFVTGMIVGAYVSGSASAKPQATTTVHITETHARQQETVSIHGEVIGFACGSEVGGGSGSAQCYILSR